MKKLLSILLVLIMVSSCFMLASCNWSEIFGKITSTTTTTTTLPDASTVEFEHSDNFTEDDIEFVRSLHGKKKNININERYSPISYDIYMTLWYATKSQHPILLVNLEDDNPYLIAAYIKPNMSKYEYDENGSYCFDVRRYFWCKFNNSEDVLSEFEGMPLSTDSYWIFDCTLRKDIVNDIEYNEQKKFYMQYDGKDYSTILKEEMLMFYIYPHEIIGDSKYIPYCYPYRSYITPLYIDEDGNKYLREKGELFVINNDGSLTLEKNRAELYFKEFYDILSPYFTRFDKTDYRYENGYKKYHDTYVYIEINTLIDILFREDGK